MNPQNVPHSQNVAEIRKMPLTLALPLPRLIKRGLIEACRSLELALELELLAFRV